MKLIFICSPLRGDIEGNQKRAKEYARAVALEGNIPIVPHIYFTEFLDEYSEVERTLGILMGIELMRLCDEMYVYGEPTTGMIMEIAAWDGPIKYERIS